MCSETRPLARSVRDARRSARSTHPTTSTSCANRSRLLRGSTSSGTGTTPFRSLPPHGITGWETVVVGRGTSASTRARFGLADRIESLPHDELEADIDRSFRAVVVIMSHSYETDRSALAIALRSRAAYVGALGPRRRTARLLEELGLPNAWTDPRLHAPYRARDRRRHAIRNRTRDLGGSPSSARCRARGELAPPHDTHPPGRGPRGVSGAIVAVVLAAGSSELLGYPKQLFMHRGVPLVTHVARACLASRATSVGVVVGAHALGVASALEHDAVTTIPNAAWREGMASSVRAASCVGEAPCTRSNSCS